jgi:4'-phosphopantetheinyl transferase
MARIEDLSVAWHAPDRDSDGALREHVADVLHLDLSEVSVGRLCGECGSSTHGQPWASGGVHVSLSRTASAVVTAVSLDGPVGVDVESVAEVAARWEPSLVLADGERAETPEEQAAMWCRKEAILKATGTGLRTPMTEIQVAAYDVTDVEAPDGLRAAAARGPRSGTATR